MVHPVWIAAMIGACQVSMVRAKLMTSGSDDFVAKPAALSAGKQFA